MGGHAPRRRGGLYATRRRFLTWALAIPGVAALGSLLGVIGRFLYPPASLTRGPGRKAVASLATLPVGGFVNFEYNDQPATLLRLTERDFVALSRVCTHLGCTVNWDPNRQQFNCPCHGSLFDRTGKVTRPPAPTALARFNTSVENGQIFVEAPEDLIG